MYNSPKALLKGIKTDFNTLYGGQQVSFVEGFSHKVNSNSDKETYHIFDVLGGVTEWIDKINYKDFSDFDYEIKNKDWEKSTMVDRFTLDDSKATLGTSLEVWIQTLVNGYANLPAKLVGALLESNGTAFDGTSFFSDTRPNLQGTNAIDNSLTGTGTTLAQLDADVEAARLALRKFKDSTGDPLNPNLRLAVYVPAELETKMLQLANDQTINLGSGAITNRHQGTIEVIVNDYATDTNDWYMMNTNAAFKPFIIQMRETPQFKLKDDEDEKLLKYISYSRLNVGYGNPTAIVKTTNS